jgi:hypothetical protein
LSPTSPDSGVGLVSPVALVLQRRASAAAAAAAGSNGGPHPQQQPAPHTASVNNNTNTATSIGTSKSLSEVAEQLNARHRASSSHNVLALSPMPPSRGGERSHRSSGDELRRHSLLSGGAAAELDDNAHNHRRHSSADAFGQLANPLRGDREGGAGASGTDPVIHRVRVVQSSHTSHLNNHSSCS